MPNPLPSLTGWLAPQKWPRIPCPECNDGAARFEDSTTVKDLLSVEIVEQVRRGLDGPDELKGSFIGTLRCDNPRCNRQLTMAGDWIYSFEFNDETGREYLTDFFRLKYVNPAIQLIHAPDGTPRPVIRAINSASEVALINPDAAANQLRQAVEELLNALRVPKTGLDRKGKRVRLGAHARIVKYRDRRPDVAEALEAVKWIGNTGSHESGLSLAEVAEGADYLDLALRLLYDKTDMRLSRQARAVNRRKGPARNSRKRPAH